MIAGIIISTVYALIGLGAAGMIVFYIFQRRAEKKEEQKKDYGDY